MAVYVCHHCGKTLNLIKPPDKDRCCPNCGRKLRVCDNCQFFDVSGCVLCGDQPFAATHGTLCQKFEYRVAAVQVPLS
jgi:DNA-directed RNA polymerase subunit RPC12/RpoP